MSRLKTNKIAPFSGENITLEGHVLPSSTNKNLGTETNAWGELYVSTGSVNFVAPVTIGQPTVTVASIKAGGEAGVTGPTWGMIFTETNNLKGSFSVGRNNRASGTASLASGLYNTASGNYCFVQGQGNIASNDGAHAQGESTLASFPFTHAEGYQTTASGYWAHAEGRSTRTVGNASHAEGENTIAFGYASHAEGLGSVALGSYSHAEGYYTVASGSYQTVVGEYNTLGDTTSHFIVGSGDGIARKDAFKVTHSSSIIVPAQSLVPTWTGREGEMVPFVTGSTYRLYAWLGGAWRSASFS